MGVGRTDWQIRLVHLSTATYKQPVKLTILKTFSHNQWGVIVAMAAAIIANIITRGTSNAIVIVLGVSLLSFVAGRWLSYEVMMNKMRRLIDRMGGVGSLSKYKELVIVWIPLDHEITSKDCDEGREFGSMLNELIAEGEFAAFSTRIDMIGINFACEDAELMFEAARPVLQKYCPKGTYITREHVYDKSESRWERPLFEDDAKVKNLAD